VRFLLAGEVHFDDRIRRVIIRNPESAIDAVVAAVGAAKALAADHSAIARHPRYCGEGRLYV